MKYCIGFNDGKTQLTNTKILKQQLNEEKFDMNIKSGKIQNENLINYKLMQGYIGECFNNPCNKEIKSIEHEIFECNFTKSLIILIETGYEKMIKKQMKILRNNIHCDSVYNYKIREYNNLCNELNKIILFLTKYVYYDVTINAIPLMKA